MRTKRKIHFVLDASAMLAYLKQEKGYDKVSEAIKIGSSISTVNFSEVLTKMIEKEVDMNEVASRLLALGVVTEPFTEEDAHKAADIYKTTRVLGLSMGDRACLSLSLRLGLPAMTADTIWAKLGSPFRIVTLR